MPACRITCARTTTVRRFCCLLLLVCYCFSWTDAFTELNFQPLIPISSTTTTTHLFSTPPPSPKRQPRRDLQKRRRKKKKRVGVGIPANKGEEDDDFPWDTAEARPLVSSNARELGEDYWIDEEELRRQREREAQIRARDPGQIPEEKLWIEVLSPYKQNWIGLISISIVALAFIFKNFPEVIDPPMISNIPTYL